ncbi:MAG: universal stress protein [Gammaproteobacteria bacterium]|nr:universal stress protein [Gammaproteobacteria bacterium]
MERIAQPLRRRGLDVRTEVAWDYPVHEAVVRHVIEQKADLLVADSHRHIAVARWVLTNTDWELIRQCPCPVWLAKSSGTRRKVLAAVDPLHERAGAQRLDDRILTEARKAVALLGGRLAVCHADVPPVINDAAMPVAEERAPRVLSPGYVERYSEKVRQGLDRLARRYSIAPRQRFVVTGDPAVVVPRLARSLRVGLLVMGAVSRSGLDRIFIGSTAERVIDDVDCDVLVVKPRSFATRVRLKPRHP